MCCPFARSICSGGSTIHYLLQMKSRFVWPYEFPLFCSYQLSTWIKDFRFAQLTWLWHMDASDSVSWNCLSPNPNSFPSTTEREIWQGGETKKRRVKLWVRLSTTLGINLSPHCNFRLCHGEAITEEMVGDLTWERVRCTLTNEWVKVLSEFDANMMHGC